VESDRILKQGKKTSPPIRTPQGTWARTNAEKAHDFAEYHAEVFHPHPPKVNPKWKKRLFNY
jgi:hypothetical protein